MLTCCCCEYADRFPGADANPFSDAGWTIDDGSWRRVSNKLRCTSATGLIVWTTNNSRDGVETATMSASVFIDTSAAGRKIRLALGYLDDDNYIAFQITTGTGSGNDGYISIIERIAGVETEIIGRYVDIDLTSPKKVRATYTPAIDQSYAEFAATLDEATTVSTLGATANESQMNIYRRVTYTGGAKAALAVAAGSGNVNFDDFAFPYVVTDGVDGPECSDYTIAPCGTPGLISSATTALFTDGMWTTSGSIYLLRWPHNRGEFRGRINITFSDADPIGKYTELYVDWLDGSNYHYARIEYKPAGKELTAWKVTGGTPAIIYGPTLLAGGLSNSFDYSICDSEHNIQYPGNGGLFDVTVTSVLHGGGWWGFKTTFGTVSNVNIHFNKDGSSAYDDTYVSTCYECDGTLTTP